MTRKSNRQEIRKARQFLKNANANAPELLTAIKEKDWPPNKNKNLVKVYRSKTFMVQEYEEKESTRLSICRTSINDDGSWKSDIKWEELQEIKRQCGYGDQLAVEIYPKNQDIVNVANMRHLWIIDNLDIGWRS